MTAKQIMVLGFQGNRDLTLLPSKSFLTNRALTLGVQLNLLTRGRATHACRLTRDCAKTYLRIDVYAFLHTVNREGFAFTVLYRFRRFLTNGDLKLTLYDWLGTETT